MKIENLEEFEHDVGYFDIFEDNMCRNSFPESDCIYYETSLPY